MRSEWQKVSQLKVGQQIAVPKDDVLDMHNRGLINRRENKEEDDILWDEIESIKHIGTEQVWDIEVEGTHNFIGNNIFAHNTYLGGNLGIGTTSPGSALDIGSSDMGDGVAGPIIILGRNMNATNPGAGSINF